MESIEIEDYYPYNFHQRYGNLLPEHKEIRAILERDTHNYTEFLNSLEPFMEVFKKIPFEKEDEKFPYWHNYFLPALDIMALYGMIVNHQPKRYIEIGSGNSTKVANIARIACPTKFKITSIDPWPRAEIDSLCDEIIRTPLEEVDLAFIDSLEANDILFFDGSHRVHQNTDNQVFFFEIFPRLKSGVLIHIHDIFWPNDYPESWTKRLYNEQYVLGAMLLYSPPELFKIMFPAQFVSLHVKYPPFLHELWSRSGFEEIERHGASFWLTKK